MKTDTQNHEHNGVDSKRLPARSIQNLPQDAIANPSGGATQDTQARAQLTLLLDAMRAAGIIRT